MKRTGMLNGNKQLRAILAFAVIGLAGGASYLSDVQRFVAAEKAKRPGPIEPLPQIRPYDSFTYQAQNRRSPFVPDTDPGQAAGERRAGTGTGIQPDFDRNREYLEQFPLDALRMVGTIEASNQSYALVTDADGAVHRVQPGNFLGQNHGKIVGIGETQIRVTEIIPDGLGGWMERQAALGLDN
jgi:type IV pilus assembly protein PilP